MAKKINWDEYNIRTLAYYQKQGGVYSDLITVLQKARTDRDVVSYIPKHTPARLLNIASYIADLAMEDKRNSAQLIDDQKQQYANRLKDDQHLVFSIVYILIGHTDCEGANAKLKLYIGTSIIYGHLESAYRREAFKNGLPLRTVLSSEQQEQYEAIIEMNKQTIRIKDEIIESLNSTIADQSNHIDEMQKAISRLAQEKESAQAAAFRGSKLDKTLTLDYIINQIEQKRTYENSRQLIDLLKGRLMLVATEEELAKIEQVEQRMLDASVPSIHNDIRNSHVFQAPVHNPTFQLPIGFTEEMLKEAIEQYLNRRNDGYTE